MKEDTRLMEALKVEDEARERALLVALSGPEMGRQIAVSGDVQVGRGTDNEVVIDQDSVSRSHCVLRWVGGQALLRDTESRNGTKVNGVALLPAEEVVLCSGDRLELGEVIYKFLLEGDVEALYHEELRRKANLDALTGAFNKGYLLEHLSREMLRSRRHGRALAVLLFDVDHFKALNDRHGHLLADRVLEALVQRVRRILRKEDLLARFGGEEFVIVLPETGAAGARQMGERLRETVAATPFLVENRDIRVTVSVGVGLLEEEMRTPVELLDLADSMLYRAKRGGRDRVAG